ncbi:MAG: glycosyltransferase [Acetobacteraceae bacterium]
MTAIRIEGFRCDICAATSVSHTQLRGDEKRVLFCAGCGMGVIENPPERTTAFYDDDYYHRPENGGPGYADYEFTASHTLLWTKLLIERLVRGGRILDIGCADGFLLHSLEGSFEKHGIEANPTAAARAAARQVHVIGADLLDPGVSPDTQGRFDVITAIATYEHVLSLRTALSKSLSLLKDDGILLFEVPLISNRGDNAEWFNSSYEHIFYPTVPGLERLFGQFHGYHFTGFESEIARFSSTYIGAASCDGQVFAEIERLFAAMTKPTLEGLDPEDRRLNLSYTVVHSFLPTAERILALPDLLERYHSRPLLTRLMQLWHGDSYARKTAEAQAAWWETQAANWKSAYDNLAQANRTAPPGTAVSPPRVLALLPFLVEGALSLAVLRDMRRRGFDVTIAWRYDASAQYTPDPVEEFRATGRAIDLTQQPPDRHVEILRWAIEAADVQLVLQIGAAPLYQHLFALKEVFPEIAIVDTLYNEIGHTTNHFLFEQAIDGVIVESQHMRRFVEGCTLKADPKVRVIESGVVLDRFRPRPRGLSGDGLLIGYVGRLSPEKNPIAFIELAERLCPHYPDARFTLVGEGPMAGEVRRRVQASPAGGAISFLGYAESAAAALQELDVLIVPSKLDGRPNIIMEANACAVPVIAAPVGGIPEMIEEGRNGFLVKPDDTARIREILDGWRADPATLDAMRHTARLTAETNFDRKRMMDAYALVFSEFAHGISAESPPQPPKEPAQ